MGAACGAGGLPDRCGDVQPRCAGHGKPETDTREWRSRLLSQPARMMVRRGGLAGALMAALPAAGGGLLTEGARVEYLTITESVAYFRLAGAGGRNPEGCENSRAESLAMVPGDHWRFDLVYSTLLAAQTTGSAVKIWVDGCHERWGEMWPRVVTVHLLE